MTHGRPTYPGVHGGAGANGRAVGGTARMTPYYVALRAPHETCRRHPLPPNPIRTGVGARIRCSRESERGRPVSVSARTPSRARWPTSEPGPARGADRASTPLPAAMPPKSRRTSSRDRRCRPRRSAPSANDRRTMQRQAGLQNCTGYHAAPTNQAAIAVSAGRAPGAAECPAVCTGGR